MLHNSSGFMYTFAPNTTFSPHLHNSSGESSNAPGIFYPITFWVFLGLESLLIITGNGMLCWVFCNSRKLRTQQNYFIMSLSISDLLVGLTVGPCEYCALLRYFQPNRECEYFCGSVLSFNMLASTFNLVLIAADRFFSIMRPFQYQKMTKSRARFLIFIAWLLTLFLVTISLSWILNESISQAMRMKIVVIYSISLFAMIFIIGLLLGVCYFLIIRMIHSKMKGLQGGAGGKSKTGVKVCILVAVSFFLCWIPMCITELIILIQKEYPSQIWMNVSYFIFLMNPCLDPIMYAYYRRDFRHEVAQWRARRWKSIKKLYDRLFLSGSERERQRLKIRLSSKKSVKSVGEMTTCVYMSPNRDEDVFL